MNQNYYPPVIFSTRIGFSADHSHECYGCLICGEWGSNIKMKTCAICLRNPVTEEDFDFYPANDIISSCCLALAELPEISQRYFVNLGLIQIFVYSHV